MIAFAASSALVKLYVDEAGYDTVRALAGLVAAAVARVEVPAVFWRKHRLGELDAADARVLTAAFEADWYGTGDDAPRFVVVAVTPAVLDDAAALCARYPLRDFDAIQLACALAVRAVDPGMGAIVVYDHALQAAAAAEGLAVLA